MIVHSKQKWVRSKGYYSIVVFRCLFNHSKNSSTNQHLIRISGPITWKTRTRETHRAMYVFVSGPKMSLYEWLTFVSLCNLLTMGWRWPNGRKGERRWVEQTAKLSMLGIWPELSTSLEDMVLDFLELHREQNWRHLLLKASFYTYITESYLCTLQFQPKFGGGDFPRCIMPKFSYF